MSNREQRRAARKAAPRWKRMTHDQKLAALVKNGITPKDLDAAYEDGRLAGIDGTYQITFAAACMALDELHGFDAEQICAVLERMQRHIVDSLTSAEAVQEVFRRTGLELDFGDPLHWVELADEA